jgi:hypothetical protein
MTYFNNACPLLFKCLFIIQCNRFGQDSGNSHSEHNCKCGLLQDAGDCGGLAYEEQGAKKTKGEGYEQDVTESLAFGLDNGGCLGASQRSQVQ